MNSHADSGTRVCASCGYDLSGSPGLPERCPECGAACSEWEGRWRLGMVHLGLTLVVWGAVGCAVVWSAFAAAVLVSPTAASVGTRAAMPLAFVPESAVFAGIGMTVLGTPRGNRGRRWALGTIGATALLLAFLLVESGQGSIFWYDPSAWFWLHGLRFEAGLALVVLTFIAVGVLCANTAAAARSVGMDRTAAGLGMSSWAAPLGAAALIGGLFVYQWVADSHRQSGSGIPVPGSASPAPVPWLWTAGVDLASILVYGALAAAGFWVWVALLAVRLRIGQVLAVQPRG